MHDSPVVHARRRQPPTIGENRLLFCANGEQEEKKGAKAAESEEVKLYGILPPITKVCPSARSNNPACYGLGDRFGDAWPDGQLPLHAQEMPPLVIVLALDREDFQPLRPWCAHRPTTERVIRGQQRASWRGVACSLVVLSLPTWPPSCSPRTRPCGAFACRPLRSLSASRF